jgi:acyl dehydratase
MQPGEVISWTRTFQREDVEAFSRISGDRGRHHLVPDRHGRLLVQGLLTATLPTKIGGDLNFIAREMSLAFRHPVFVGDTVRCEVRLDRLEGPAENLRLDCSWVCTNQEGTVVMTGSSSGVIRSTVPGDLTGD